MPEHSHQAALTTVKRSFVRSRICPARASSPCSPPAAYIATVVTANAIEWERSQSRGWTRESPVSLGNGESCSGGSRDHAPLPPKPIGARASGAMRRACQLKLRSR